MDSRHDDWATQSPGPVVRPYALTAGRTRPSGTSIDLIALVTAVRRASRERPDLEPEHLRVLRLCRLPMSVADLASDLDLPLGVVRILLADLREQGLVSIHQPAQAGLADVRILKEVADALRRL
jgi:DNA-binding transcriptional ArsR family regulator